ncbi:MAG: DNA topoisomerase 3 [Myxococcales bacterium]|nr:DNA topoisomerase 3 [Myxococcales bacterium]
MTTAVLAEKPSVARDIAKVLGATHRRDGALEGNGYVVTWAIGHLASPAQPHEIDAQWKRWSLASLPMIPKHWPLRVYEKTRHQFEIIKQILCDRDIDEVVCATDAGREGELIFRFIYEAAGATKPVRRLWISSLTDDAIRRGFADLRPAQEFDGLADAARGRSRADWLVGMNLTRAYTLRQGGPREMLSVGRVQTPTLAMVVDRELAIRRFVSEDYKEVRAVFRPTENADQGVSSSTSYEGVYIRPETHDLAPAPATAADHESKPPEQDSSQRGCRLPVDGSEAQRIADRARAGTAQVRSVSGRQRRLPPPLFYDLTELQRHANRLYGFSAKKTLDLAQALYEKKLLSYPRTDSRVLTRDDAKTLPRIVAAISPGYTELLAEGCGSRPLGARFVDDAKVRDHHALIPTDTARGSSRLGRDEQRIYDLVCRRLLAAWHEDHLYSTTTVITAITQSENDESVAADVDLYRSTGTKLDQVGWRVLDPPLPSAPRKTEVRKPRSAAAASLANRDPELPPQLRPNLPVEMLEVHVDDKATRPPRRFTEATLLTAMETAGKTLDDKDLSEAMRECGLGTPATRAGIIEILITRAYLKREKKTLLASDKGIRLIGLVHPHSKSPAMTGHWEAKLQQIQDGSVSLERFISEIEQYVRDVVASVKHDDAAKARSTAGAPPRAKARTQPSRAKPSGAAARSAPPAAPTLQDTSANAPPKVPTPSNRLHGLLRDRFGFERFRPHQEEVCRTLTEGSDVLLVMPTGAGKSLCYQLPGIARAGTTLVVSPLIALMEDQVIALKQRGFIAERIHSGRSREDSRQVCFDYLAGRLDFLFIAPERLSVPGFPEMLARRKPALIAIDEAHCISQWGHDFRPDYRMLKERLPLLRPAPIVALTATATMRVQHDIVEQLAVPGAQHFIHGFRRDNIAIEVVELKPSLRNDTAARLLSPSDRRPAIVYAPTRKKAEALADELGEDYPTAAYHAGMDPERRDKVHAAFLAGSLEVVVATVAFGMGIDKPDVRSVIHLALPGSVESYYQEIGRAGRDGLPSRAFLLHGYIDRRTHEWFLNRDYPDTKVLAKIFAALGDQPIDKTRLQQSLKLDPEEFERALEKLRIHGGAVAGPGEATTRGHDRWREPYRAQLEHRKAQLDEIARFADSRGCRMLRLVRHFGDQADSEDSCGHCDFCAPAATLVADYGEATPAQQSAMERILKSLNRESAPSSGRLFNELFGQDYDRGLFEVLLAALHRAGYIHIEEESFESEGRLIEFQRPVITPSGGRAGAAEIANVRIAAEGLPRKKNRRPAKSKRSTRSVARKKSSARKKSRTTRKPRRRS